jgi:hypothetical protein
VDFSSNEMGLRGARDWGETGEGGTSAVMCNGGRLACGVKACVCVSLGTLLRRLR